MIRKLLFLLFLLPICTQLMCFELDYDELQSQADQLSAAFHGENLSGPKSIDLSSSSADNDISTSHEALYEESYRPAKVTHSTWKAPKSFSKRSGLSAHSQEHADDQQHEVLKIMCPQCKQNFLKVDYAHQVTSDAIEVYCSSCNARYEIIIPEA